MNKTVEQINQTRLLFDQRFLDRRIACALPDALTVNLLSEENDGRMEKRRFTTFQQNF